MKTINVDEIEIIQPEDSDSSFKSFMDKIDPPNSKVPQVTYTLPNMDLDSVKVGQESINSVLELHKEYNQKYGIDFKFNTDDVARMFQSIISPERKKVMELYLSEAFSRFRLVVYQKLMFGIMQLVQDITSPAHLTESIEVKAVLIEKLQLYMENIEKMYEKIHNEHTEEELAKLSESTSSSTSYDFNNPEVQQVIQRLNQTILKSNEEIS